MTDNIVSIECEHIEEGLQPWYYNIDIKHQTDPEDDTKQIVTTVVFCPECYKRLESSVIHGLIRELAETIGKQVRWRR